MEFKKHVLKNGLRVILSPMRDTETVTVQILVEAGSKYENKKNNGISHFLEHMMFKGTKKRPKARIISEELDSVGSEYNAFTDKEQTGYWVKMPRQHFSMALDVVSDMYLNALLPKGEIERERGVILQELSMYNDTPMARIWEIFEDLLYGDQPAGWRIIGTEKNIREIQRSDFVSYMRDNYQPKYTVVSIAGNFDEKEALQQVRKIFGGIKNGRKKTIKKKVAEKQNQSMLKVHFKETDQTHLLVGFRSLNMFSKDRYALAMVDTILGGGMSSRMFYNIRERNGLTYYIHTGSSQTTDTGYSVTAAGVEHKNLEKAVKLILNEYKKIASKKVSAKEFKKAKEYVKGKMEMALESSDEVASFAGNQELFRKRVKKPQEILAEIDKVTQDDIIRVARKIFTKEGLNLAVIGPHKNENRLKKILSL